jgi:hypothetical protein
MRLTVIIPNYNGAKFIPSLCRGLKSQKLAKTEFEVIFVDNGSKDDSRALMEKHAQFLPNLQILSYTEQQGSYAARNFGVQHAESDLLVFTDTDCIPNPNWLAEIVRIAEELSGVFLIAGDVELFPRDGVFNCFELYDKAAFLNQRKYSSKRTGATANLAVSRQGYEKAGGFPEVFSGGDLRFCSKVMSISGSRFIFSEVGAVLHPARCTMAEIVKKLTRLGRGKARLLHQAGEPLENLRVLAIQILGFILLPHQWRLILTTFRELGCRDKRAWLFLPLSLFLGWYQRGTLIVRFVALMRGRTSLPD